MTATAPAPGFVPTEIRGIEKELSRLLAAEQDEGAPPIQRARMSNLVVFADRPEMVETISAEMPAIVKIHPARVIMLAAEPASEAYSPTAEVRLSTKYAHGRQEVGLEQITLRAGGHHVDRLPSIVRGLLIGDLPTNLWWASETPPSLAGPLLDDLAENAQQVFYDSFGWSQPARGMLATASWLEAFERGPGLRYRVAHDLTWRRLKGWRRIVAQSLDPYSAPGLLESVREVVVEHGPHSVMVAWSLASWMTLRLGWQVRSVKVEPGVEINWQLTSRQGPRQMRIRRLPDGPSGLRRVCVNCGLDDWTWSLSVQPTDEMHLAVVSDESDKAARTVTVKPQPLSELVGRQLSDRESDPVFHQTMAVAQSLARSVLGT